MKERLDKLLVRKRFFESREKAQGHILGGDVSVNGERVLKPGRLVSEEAEIKLLRRNDGYVSRGGIKLEGALDAFGLDAAGAYCLDVGASTGGFTDCLLKRGASHVVALDVGKNQLAYSLRVNPRVTVVEEFNARDLAGLETDRLFDLVTVDVSFISVTRILAALGGKIHEGSRVIVLIKPQFELQRPFKGFDGVVRDRDIHVRVLRGLLIFFSEAGYRTCGLTFSRIRGPKGNIEFFALLETKDAGVKPGTGSVNETGVKVCGIDPAQRYVEKIAGEAHEFFEVTAGGRK
jgi:23S rRNA (cytidine1920-2'-O)/16S rRNA (cytidine1409-2'-O)-methyltransferase